MSATDKDDVRETAAPSQREHVPPGRRRSTDDGDVAVAVRDLQKFFQRANGELVRAVDGVSLEVHRGEMMVLLGPSGCGKTTLLRCIAGLEIPSGGEIRIGEKVVSSSSVPPVPPEKRRVGMMFQSYALWPHMTVNQNVAYPLAARKVPRSEIGGRVAEILNVVGIGELGEQHPSTLSGGQQQRVALARSLVGDPKVMLFDEPLSNVDAKVREQLRYELLDMQQRLGFAGVYVTHDQDEAMQLADRLVVMKAGQAEQVGTPRQIYRAPSSRYVAHFVGSANEVDVAFDADGGAMAGDGGVAVQSRRMGRIQAANGTPGSQGREMAAWVAILRPEDLRLHQDEPSVQHSNLWKGAVTHTSFLGPHEEYIVALDCGIELRGRAPATHEPLQEGIAVWIAIDPSAVRILPKGQAS